MMSYLKHEWVCCGLHKHKSFLREPVAQDYSFLFLVSGPQAERFYYCTMMLLYNRPHSSNVVNTRHRADGWFNKRPREPLALALGRLYFHPICFALMCLSLLQMEELVGEGYPDSGHDLLLLLYYLSWSHSADDDCEYLLSPTTS